MHFEEQCHVSSPDRR